MITHVQIVHVPVSDQDKAKEFYVSRMGLEVIDDVTGGPWGRWLRVAVPGAATSLALVPGDEQSSPGSATVVFESDDLEADAVRLRDADVDVPNEIMEMPWARSVLFRDPDGNQLGLQSLTKAV